MGEQVPEGVKIATAAIAAMWFGWGFVETIVPVFLYGFSKNYLETGLLHTTFGIVFLLALPVVGVLADRISCKRLLVGGMALYVFVGLGYALSGFTGAIIFVILARMINGVSFAMYNVGRHAYFRRQTSEENVASIFGYFQTFATFWWLVALLLSLVLINYIHLHWMFLAISFGGILAFALMLKLPADKGRKENDVTVLSAYKVEWKEIRHWRKGLKYLGFFTLFLGLIQVIVGFFVPLLVYTQHESLQQVILLTAVMTIPVMFSHKLGILADKVRLNGIYVGIALLMPMLVTLAFVPYLWQVVTAFFIAVTLEFLARANDSVLAHLVHPSHYGRVDSVMEMFDNISDMAGPAVFALLITLMGEPKAFLAIAGFALVAIAVLMKGRRALMGTEEELIALKHFVLTGKGGHNSHLSLPLE